MKTGIFSLLLLASILLQAQQSKIIAPIGVSGSFENIAGGVNAYDPEGKILYSIIVSPIGKSTTQNYPYNPVNDLTNFSYYDGIKSLKVSFLFDSSINISDMRYRIIGAGSKVVTDWKIPDENVIYHKPKDIVEITGAKLMPLIECLLPPVNSENNIISVQLYNIFKPENMLTQITSTLPIEKPALFGSVTMQSLAFIPVRDSVYNTIPLNAALFDLEGEHKLEQEDMVMQRPDIYLNTKNSPFVYNIYLVREIAGIKDSVLLPVTWREMGSKEMLKDSIAKRRLAGAADSSFIYWTTIPMEFVNKEGSYEILIAPKFWEDYSVYKNNISTIKFKINPSGKWVSARVVRFLFFLILLLLLLFLAGRLKQKRLLQRKEVEVAEAKLKLQSLRSQLNPHFIFNALSGIQNLMNKNETEKANNYLNTFSRLTRNVLDDSANETITLNNEIKLLDDYLKMEQLRFGFQYNINVDANLDKHNIEIPSMLLQPFAENAVKHGIVALKENGRIDIDFTKSDNNVVLSVADNGEGFDANGSYSGMGLQLSKNRISLLNTVYKNTPFNLQINSSDKGTKAIITLQNWLS